MLESVHNSLDQTKQVDGVGDSLVKFIVIGLNQQHVQSNHCITTHHVLYIVNFCFVQVDMRRATDMLYQRRQRENAFKNLWSDRLSFRHIPEEPLRDWDEVMPAPKVCLNLASIFVFFVAVLCFWNSCSGEFVFDDQEAIINNQVCIFCNRCDRCGYKLLLCYNL